MIFFTPYWVSGTRRKSNFLLCEARKVQDLHCPSFDLWNMHQLAANLFRGTLQAKRDVLKHFYPFWSKSVHLIIPVEWGWARVAMWKTSQALWQQQQCQNNQMWPMDRPTEGPTDQPKSKPVYSAFLPSSRICPLNPSDLSLFLMFFTTATVSSIKKDFSHF